MNHITLESAPSGVTFNSLERGALFRFIDNIDPNNVYIKTGISGAVFLKNGEPYPISPSASVKLFEAGTTITLLVA